jgi:hypothetical protein
VDRNVIRATATARAQDVITSAQEAAATQAPTAHAEDAIISAHTQDADTEVGAAASDRSKDVASAVAVAGTDCANDWECYVVVNTAIWHVAAVIRT